MIGISDYHPTITITNGGQAPGKAGIGTTNPQYPLSVNGTIQAKEVIVNSGWSDYVFDAGYRLQSLESVANYIKANHHLPGMPSAAEIQERGVCVGDIESKLLAKVEELTLHMIRLEENEQLRRKVETSEPTASVGVQIQAGHIRVRNEIGSNSRLATCQC